MKREKRNQNKEERRRPKYGLFSCVGYIYRILWQAERGLAFTAVLTVPVSLGLSALTLYTPSVVLAALEKSERFGTVALTILGLLLTQLLFDLANNVIHAKNQNAEHRVVFHLQYIWAKHQRERDWYHDYDPEVQKADERAFRGIGDSNATGTHFPVDFANILTQLLNFVLFGAVASMLHPAMILLLALGCGLDAFMGRWERRENRADRDIRNELEKKIQYSTGYFSQTFDFAKEIRLYGMRDFLRERLIRLFGQSRAESKKVKRRGNLTAAVSFLVILVRDALTYGFLIREALAGRVDAASFVLYFSAVTSLSGVMGGILGMMNRVLEGAMQLSDFREALELSDRLNRGPGIPLPKGPFSVEFRNVSYRYPKGEKKVLDHISFRIEAGEKVALVGLNGAGKTTLVRLMCGLLLPDEGEILLDGHSLYEYNRDEMYSMFGVVPQDYNLLPVTLARNIACTAEEEEIDGDRLRACIVSAGLAEKIDSLPQGADTPLGRELCGEGVELSGGETQKLLLARLLYKDPLCMILDEPTAALDPIAEDKMYRSYNEIAARATSVFISHRLASTRFCDRIFLLDDAGLAETGSHDQLMAAGGKYREMFDIQSRYYREQAGGRK